MLLFTELAEHYFALEARRTTLLRDIRGLLRLLRDRQCRHVLDLGCGTGEHAAILQRAGLHLTGVDRSDAMIAIARRRFPGVAFRHGDIRVPCGSPRDFDGAYSLFGTFNYLNSDDDLQRAFDSVGRLLRPGGLFVLEVWNRAAYRGLSEAVRSPDRIVRAGAREIRRRREVYLDEAVGGALVIRHNYELHPGRRGQASEFLEEHHRLHPRDAEELRNFGASAQLRLVERYADLSGKASRDSNVGLVLVFKKEATHIGR